MRNQRVSFANNSNDNQDGGDGGCSRKNGNTNSLKRGQSGTNGSSSHKNNNKNDNDTYVYVRSEDHAWVPAIQIWASKDGKPRATVIRPIFKTEQQMMQCGSRSTLKKSVKEYEVDLSEYPNGLLPMQNVDANGNLEGYPDMVALPFMHEAALLYNLKQRHIAEKPYTRTGDIVIAVNPYKWYPELYTEKKRSYYAQRLVWDYNSDQDPRTSMEPHVYEVSALAYKGLTMGDDGEHQSILVSGESGAGKTETVKICLNHIASTQRGQYDTTATGRHSSDNQNDPIVQRIVDSNPLLEAFGNAKTRRNDNSSRFGKYLQLQFDRRSSPSRHSGSAFLDTGSRSRHCALVGSKCEVYLLEKNRVVQHEASERNFHIFYQLLASSHKTKFWQKLKGADPSSFAYVGAATTTTTTTTCEPEHDDAAQFEETLRALSLIHIKGDLLMALMQAVCVVLQLGNLGFAADPADNDHSIVSTLSELANLAELMNVTEHDLTKAFTQRTFTTQNETHKVPLNAASAKEACDALAKEIYQKIFLWLVQKINQATSVVSNNGEDAESSSTKTNIGLIGLLDIFGFETFKVNRFEQLCINYANEKLQQKFTQDVFRCVQEEYHAEGIPLKDIYYDDNTNVLDLIEGRPTGLLALLNEECVRPKGNAMEYVQKALKANRESPCLKVHPTDRLSFGIQHYAGQVMYDAEGFVERNQDTLPTDLQECAEKCSNDIVRAQRSEPATRTQNQAAATTSRRYQQSNRRESNLVAPTVWTKYKNQLQNLMGLLHQTRSRYIRCIKPNNQKAPLLLEHKPVLEQLRCAGVVAGITITRSVFPNSLENTAVLARYSSMGGSHLSSNKQEACKALLRAALHSKRVRREDTGEMVDAFVVGKTKTYFRAGALEWLEMNRLGDLDSQAITIQTAARGWLVRQRQNGGVSFKARKLQLEHEERQRRELEEQQLRERQEKRHARRMEREAQVNALRNRVEALRNAIQESDRSTKAKVADLRERRNKAQQEVDEYEEAMQEQENDREQRRFKVVQTEQQKKLAENKKLIEFLRQEGKKSRTVYDKLKKKWDALKHSNDLLEESNSTICCDFDGLNEETRVVNDSMHDISFVLDKTRQQNKQLRQKVFEIQEKYVAQAEARLEYQKTMARIMEMIQERSRKRSLTEHAVVVALNCEAETKSIMCALEAETEPNLLMSDVSEVSESSYY
ncbi:hypothetical protein ACA910_010536 [Epithemia clementina (nom. ined.)]